MFPHNKAKTLVYEDRNFQNGNSRQNIFTINPMDTENYKNRFVELGRITHLNVGEVKDNPSDWAMEAV